MRPSADQHRRERFQPCWRIEATWCSLAALLLAVPLTAASLWAAFTFLPESQALGGRNDYRFILGLVPFMIYPWVHGGLRRIADG